MRIVLLILGMLIGAIAQAQSTYQTGLLPSINLNKKLAHDWRLNCKIESRQALSEGRLSEKKDLAYNYILTDLALIAAKKVGLNNRLAGGYLSRFRNGALIHRLIQQFTLVKRGSGYRLAQRIAADQTFAQNRAISFRFRYRFTIELPLNGQSVNPTEFYLKINHEYLNALQGGNYDLETRLVPLIGYVFTDNNKIECGLDYRLSDFISAPPQHRLWLSLNWYYAL